MTHGLQQVHVPTRSISRVYGDALAVQVGRSMWSVPTTATTSASVPVPPPRPMVGAITRSSANFSWQPPTDDGGSPVVLYRVGASWLAAAAVACCWAC